MIRFPRAEFFDIFGIVVFGIVVLVSARALFGGEEVPLWALVFFLGVGIVGFIIDGIMVYRAYLRRGGDTGVNASPVVK